MDLTQASNLISELQKIPQVPKVKIIETGDEGVILCLKKNLVNPGALRHIQEFANQHNLSLTDSKGYYLITNHPK